MSHDTDVVVALQTYDYVTIQGYSFISVHLTLPLVGMYGL